MSFLIYSLPPAMDQGELKQEELLDGASEEVPKESPIDSEFPPKVSEERFGNETKSSERTPNHTLTIRQVSKIFEDNHIALTERTILNWCHKNKRGIFRLDSFFDPVEAKYYITLESLQQAITEEQTRLNISPNPPETFSETPKTTSEPTQKSTEEIPQLSEDLTKEDEEFPNSSEGSLVREVRDLRREKYQLEVEKGAQERIIKQYEKQQDNVFEFISEQAKELGNLQEKVRQLEGPKEHPIKADIIKTQEAHISAPDIKEGVAESSEEQEDVAA